MYESSSGGCHFLLSMMGRLGLWAPVRPAWVPSRKACIPMGPDFSCIASICVCWCVCVTYEDCKLVCYVCIEAMGSIYGVGYSCVHECVYYCELCAYVVFVWHACLFMSICGVLMCMVFYVHWCVMYLLFHAHILQALTCSHSCTDRVTGDGVQIRLHQLSGHDPQLCQPHCDIQRRMCHWGLFDWIVRTPNSKENQLPKKQHWKNFLRNQKIRKHFSHI